jgi:quercetin dioxygenase-like cupin family protein
LLVILIAILEKQHLRGTKRKTLWFLGDYYTEKINASETQGRYAIWEIEVEKGPPLHKHSREDEGFYVLEGKFAFPYGNSETNASKGEFAYAPRGQFHTHKNIGDSIGKLLLVATPADNLEKFLKETGIVVDERSSFKEPQITPADIEKVITIANKHGLEVRI